MPGSIWKSDKLWRMALSFTGLYYSKGQLTCQNGPPLGSDEGDIHIWYWKCLWTKMDLYFSFGEIKIIFLKLSTLANFKFISWKQQLLVLFNINRKSVILTGKMLAWQISMWCPIPPPPFFNYFLKWFFEKGISSLDTQKSVESPTTKK